jgi:hypothetical protein
MSQRGSELARRLAHVECSMHVGGMAGGAASHPAQRLDVALVAMAADLLPTDDVLAPCTATSELSRGLLLLSSQVASKSSRACEGNL